jgi:hypothetical protein
MTRSQEFTNVANAAQFTCDSITFPPTGADVYPVQRYGYGAFEQRPVLPKLNQVGCTFICDKDANVMKFFHAWTRLICNFNFDNIGMSSPSNEGMTTYEVAYKADYASDINIQLYSPTGNLVNSVIFRDAFPSPVDQIPLNWAKADREPLRIAVLFNYTDWFNA